MQVLSGSTVVHSWFLYTGMSLLGNVFTTLYNTHSCGVAMCFWCCFWMGMVNAVARFLSLRPLVTGSMSWLLVWGSNVLLVLSLSFGMGRVNAVGRFLVLWPSLLLGNSMVSLMSNAISLLWGMQKKIMSYSWVSNDDITVDC